MTTKETGLTSLIQLCELFPWHRALFTTYTLSLSFFEAFVLRALEKVGCSDITVVVDHSFYLESLAERQSRSAGRDYRIMPVRMRTNGVFHPKVAYFWGDHQDLIAVGSGNLTYAGQGVNLECLDVLSSTANPSAFIDIEDFFTALVDTQAIELCGDPERLTQYRDRARRMGRKAVSQRGPKVLHSIKQPIFLQVVHELEAFRPLTRLVCMAPFHHPQGAPVFDLAAALGATHVDIGIDPIDQLAPFAMGRENRKGVKTRYVVPAKENHRTLHAKWYEFHGKTSHVLTGSVNATEAALKSTENVEVAILRQIARGEGLSWIEKNPTGTADRERKTASSLFDGFITASIGDDDLLRGTVYAPKPAGTWRATVYSRFCEWSFDDALVDTAGTFSLGLPTAFAEFREVEEAAHIRLHRDEATVAGWIEFEFDLDAPADLRGARRALDRLSRGQARSGDIEQFVQWFYSVIGAVSGQAIDGEFEQSATSDERAKGRNRTMSYEEWAHHRSRHRILHGDVGAMFLKALTALSAGRDELIRRAQQRGHLGGLSPPDDELEGEYASRGEYDLLLDLVSAIDSALVRNPYVPQAVEILRCRLALTLRPILSRQEDFSPAGLRSLEWLRLACSLNLKPESRSKLLGTAWALAGLALVLTPVDATSGRAVVLKQLLERLAIELPEIDPKTAAQEAFHETVLSETPSPLVEGSLAAVDRILSTTTIRDDLKALLKTRSGGGRPLPSAALVQILSARVLQKLSYGTRPIEVANPSIDGCPKCYTAISKAEQGDLKARRAIVCLFCGCALVWLGYSA